MVDPIDLNHEGRIAQLEAKIDKVLPLIESIYADMIERNARWAFIHNSVKYLMWLAGGAASALGLAKANAWLGQYPGH